MDTVMIRSREYTYSQTIGRGSAGGNGFSEPVDIAIDGDPQKLYTRYEVAECTGILILPHGNL